MRIRVRRFQDAAVLLVVAILVGMVVVVAVRADARSTRRAETNDGGAWLVKGDAGVIGHVNRVAMEVAGVVSVAEPNSDFDVEQRGSLVVVNDRSTETLTLVDPRTYQKVNTMAVPPRLQMAPIADGVVLWTTSPLSVWRVTRAELAATLTLNDLTPAVTSEGDGLVTVTRADTTLVVDRTADRLVRIPDGGAGGDPATAALALEGWAESIAAISAVGEDLVVADEDGVALLPADVVDDEALAAARADRIRGDGIDPLSLVLAQPTEAGGGVAATGADGAVLTAPATPPETDDPWVWTQPSSIGAADPLPSIVHQGCVFALAADPVTFTRTCDGEEDARAELGDLDASSLRLRLVNGWVWINDLRTGRMAVIGREGELERLDDWGSILGQDDDSEEDPEQSDADEDVPDDGQTVIIEDQLPEIDEDGINEPPVAMPDEARTRADVPVVVPVLDNDTDPDGDVVLVTGVSDLPEGAQIAPNADRTAVQVTPPPAFTGELSFTYTISDGRPLPDGGPSTDSATVVVTVTNDDADNADPVAVDDDGEVAAGSTLSLNVLHNDTDPDGDAVLLESITVDEGVLHSDPSGQISFTPPPTSAEGEVRLPYVVRDTYGGTAEAEVVVRIRLRESNNEPNAENDSGSTTVGRPITFNVLANDSDPDNDPLSVAGLLEVLSGPPEALDLTSMSPDGEFFFSPESAGEYVFIYSVTDGSERDRAVIRIDVSEVQENRPPVAIRDDVTIARGATKAAYVLTNDTDPDGDVVSITQWTGADGLQIEEARGIGFRITVDADAPDEVQFRYSISDGRSDPVQGVVVVAVSDTEVNDQPPITRPDTVEVRPDRTAGVRVLLNDYDPEGGTLRIVGVATAPNAEVSIGPGGQEIFVTPNERVVTSFTFGYDVADEAGNRSSSFVEVRPVPPGQPNRPPVARPDIARTRAGNDVTVPVLDNDGDPDGDAIQVTSIAQQPSAGSATVNADGTITYRASPQASGSDQFRYVIVDAAGGSAIGTVLVGVEAADGENRPPTAADDTFSLLAGSDPIALDLIANDYDPNGDEITVTSAVGASGLVRVDAGLVVFSPPATVTGEAQTFTFTYSLSDGRGGSDDATVTVEVAQATAPVAPIAVSDIVGPILIGESVDADVLANDFDPDGSRADLVVTVEGTAATVVDGLVRVVAGEEATEVVYTVTDPDGLSARAVLTVLSTPNRPPLPLPATLETPFETPLPIDVTEFVEEPDGDPLLYTCCESVRGGRAAIGTTGTDELTVTFTPDDGFIGEGGFTYAVDDGEGHVVAGAVAVVVLPPDNRPPVATDGAAEAPAGETTPISLDALVADPDVVTGDVLRFEITGAGGAPATLRGNTVSVVPPVDAAGDTYDIAYTVTDSAGASASATVRVTVAEANVAPPTAVADVARTTQEVPVTVPVLANDIDPLGEGLTIVAATVTSGSGSAAVQGSSIVFTPGAGFFGQAAVQYTVNDARQTAAGQASGLVTISVVGFPSAPPAPQATADNATASVTWQAPNANGAPITGYQIESNQFAPVDVGLVNSRTFTGLDNGVPHRFRARAQNEAGWGEWGPWSSDVIPDTEPGRPAAPRVQFADSALIVSWTAPPNEGSAIIDYELEIGGATSAVQSVGNKTTYTWTGLTNGANYQFRVVARNRSGPSEASSFSAAEHPLREPGPPSAPTVQRGDRQLALSWQPGATNGDQISRYEVERLGGEVRSVNSTSYTWPNLPNGTPQQFRVRAFNRDPDAGAWGQWSAPVVPCGRPLAVSGVTAARGDRQATVAWNAADANGCPISSYDIETDTGLSQSSTATSHTFQPLANGTAYRFRVRALNSEGVGAWSGWSNTVTPAGPPNGPGSVAASQTNPDTVRVEWPAADPNGAPIQRYELVINGSPRAVGTGTTYDHAVNRSGATSRDTFSYQVRACNDVACGALSPTASVSTWSVPGTPSVNASADRSSFSANWNEPGSGGNAISRYEVNFNGGGWEPTGARTFSRGGLQPSTTYTIQVRACNDVGCGSAGSASATTQSARTVALRRGAACGPATGNPCPQPSSCSGTCYFYHLEASGFAPNTDYTAQCFDSQGAFNPRSIRTDGNGNVNRDLGCHSGFPGEKRVTYDGISASANW